MKYSNNQKMNKYLEDGVKNKLVAYEFEGVIFWHMHRFYEFMSSANAMGPLNQYLKSLIEGYIEAKPGEYKFEFGEQSIPFSIEKHNENLPGIKNKTIHF